MRFFKLYIVILLIISNYLLLSAQNSIKIDFNSPENVKAGTEFNISIDINKQNIIGFAKLELYLPVGFTSKIIESSGATTIRQGQLLKFIWIDLPEKSSFTLNLSISVDYRIAGYKEIFGNFYYITQKKRKKTSVGIVPFNVINTNTTSNKNNIINYTSENILILPIKNINQNIVYRVQIAANKKRISKNIMQEIYSDNSTLYEELIDGLYKYTIGNFSSKLDAENFRINYGVNGAFTVTYENGERVANKK